MALMGTFLLQPPSGAPLVHDVVGLLWFSRRLAVDPYSRFSPFFASIRVLQDLVRQFSSSLFRSSKKEACSRGKSSSVHPIFNLLLFSSLTSFKASYYSLSHTHSYLTLVIVYDLSPISLLH